jgi:hypothetical protein
MSTGVVANKRRPKIICAATSSDGEDEFALLTG